MDLYTYDGTNTVTKKTTISKVMTIKIAILKAKCRIKARSMRQASIWLMVLQYSLEHLRWSVMIIWLRQTLDTQARKACPQVPSH